MNGFTQMAQGIEEARTSAAQGGERRGHAPAALADWETTKNRDCFARRNATTLELARVFSATRSALRTISPLPCAFCAWDRSTTESEQ